MEWWITQIRAQAASYLHLWLACIAVLSGLVVGSLVFLDFYRPDWAATGTTTAVFLLLVAILRAPLSKLWTFIQPKLSWAVRILDVHRGAAFWVFLFLSTLFILGSVSMLNGFIDRYRYANVVRDTVSAHLSDTAAAPDIAVLAENYMKFPGRREIPILLARSGRIFTTGRSRLKFVAYQRGFADRIFENAKSNTGFCNASFKHHDPISFAAVAYVESSVPLAHEQSKGLSLTIERSKAALELLSSCPQTADSLQSVTRAIYATRIKNLLSLPKYQAHPYDLVAEIKAVEARIDALEIWVASELFRSHAYQEFLDLKLMVSLRQLAVLSQEKGADMSEINRMCDAVTDNLRKILSLRTSLNKGGEIRWIKSPNKLDTYQFFMALSGYFDMSQSVMVHLLKDLPELRTRLDDIAMSPAFREFLQPDTWNASTPLDASLEGAALEAFFENTLKKDW